MVSGGNKIINTQINTLCSFSTIEPPVFTSKPVSKLSVSRGSTLSLVAAGSPPPKIEWSRAESSSYSRQLLQQKGCLTIDTAKEEGYGSYTCRATNSYGVAQTSTLLTVTGNISLVSYFTFSSTVFLIFRDETFDTLRD